MSREVIPVEELEGGLRAAFVQFPHFLTDSVRLAVHAGSAHELQGEHGGAHFLEHIAFSGTAEFPTKQAVRRYAKENGVVFNATTSQMGTGYMADGYNLSSVAYIATEIPLNPVLTDSSLEGEREPIVDEIMGSMSSPYYESGLAHLRAIRGDEYGRPVAGTIHEVQVMTADTLRAFQARHYRLGNAILVIASHESTETQREFAQSLAGRLREDSMADASTAIEFGEFNPGHLQASLQQVDLDINKTQTDLTIAYGIPESTDVKEQMRYRLLAAVLSQMAFTLLREDMALCYGAGASLGRQVDLHFGRNRSWAQLNVSASLHGSKAITALNALSGTVLSKGLHETAFQDTLIQMEHDSLHTRQGNPSQIANLLANILTTSQRIEVDIREVEQLAAFVTLNSLQKMLDDILQAKPLVIATSPDPNVLDAIGEWAAAGSSGLS